MTLPAVLSIAGSDCSGGAGIQADLKTFEACRVYGMSVITAVVAENTCGLLPDSCAVHDVPAHVIALQLKAVFCDIPPAAVKIGMMHTAEAADVTAKALLQYSTHIPIVIDPVMAAKDGSILMAQQNDAICKTLFPLAFMLTPNIPEAEFLAHCSIKNMETRKAAAVEICRRYHCKTVLIKGGHSREPDTVSDMLYNSLTGQYTIVTEPRINTKNTHGTGCTYSSALASFLAHGCSAEESLKKARKYMNGAIAHSFSLGHGSGPLCHHYV